MDKPELNYRFFNSDTPEEFVKALLAVCIEANIGKAERAIRHELATDSDKEGGENEYSGILQGID